MADEKRTQQKLDQDGAEFATFVLEDVEDHRVLRFSMGFAVVAHVLFLFTPLFSFSEPEIAAKKEDKLYVVKQVRFQPPHPTVKEIPKPKALLVPVPDPTPEAPEPIRLDEQEPVDIVLPDVGDYVMIPDAPPEREQTEPLIVGGAVKEPVKVFFPQPQYTEIARRTRVEGVVIVQAIVDREGDVTNVKVLKGLSMGLSEEAVKAIKRWKFEPATLSGKPVDVYYTLTVNFQLQ